MTTTSASRRAVQSIVGVLLCCGLLSPLAHADWSDPGPYQAGWQTVSIPRPGGGSFNARLFYPATSGGQGAAYDGSGAPYPGVTFGHGWLTSVTRYQSTLEHLATWGYFVVAAESYGGLFPDHSAFADDLRWGLSYLEDQNANAGSWLYQQVETTHFGASGHSMGGGCSVLAAERDGRIRVVANMAAADTNPSAADAAASVRVPMVLLAGDEDGIAPPGQHAFLIYNQGVAPCRSPVLLGGWHCGFLDSSFFGCDNGSMPRETQLALTRHLLTSAFELYLRSDQSAWRAVWGPELADEPDVDHTRLDAGVDLLPTAGSVLGLGGQTTCVDVQVTNTGPLATSYTLLVEDQTWSTTVEPAQTPVLPPGGASTVRVSITIPDGNDAAADAILLTARVDLDGGTRDYAALNVQRVSVGDIDGDGSVALADLDAFVACLNGPDNAYDCGCHPADSGRDNDVDLADYHTLQAAIGT